MCGLVGIFGNIGEREKEAFSFLHLLDVCRGKDGAGIYYETLDGRARNLITSVSTPAEFMSSHNDHFNNNLILKQDNLKLILGHNRAATKGEVVLENSHPFEYSHVVGAHNGTLQMHSLSKFPSYKELDMDSRILYAGINEMETGESKTFTSMNDVVQEVTGAMALVWWNKRNKTLNFFRNHQRPLFTAFSDDCLFWASEDWMIELAASISNIRIKKITEYPVNEHYQLKCKIKRGKTKFIKTGQENITKNFTGTSRVVYPTRTTYGTGGTSQANNGNVKPFTPPANTGVQNLPTFRIFGEVWTKTQFDRYVKLGCSLCGSGLDFTERVNISWIDKSTPFCPSCVEDGSLTTFMSVDEIEKLETGKNVH